MLDRNGKYPQTLHFNFSKGISNDDKVISMKYTGNFINRRIIITEKLDGENTCFKPKESGLFARSHSMVNFHPSSDYIKRMFMNRLYTGVLNEDYWYFGENLFAEHSIVYENLGTYFYLFGIYDTKNDIWLSWDSVVEEANRIKIAHTPVIFDGCVNSLVEIIDILDYKTKISNGSILGGACEGGVTRIADSFKPEDFQKVMAKYVRANHVQTDKHWRENWKEAKLSKDGYGSEYSL